MIQAKKREINNSNKKTEKKSFQKIDFLSKFKFELKELKIEMINLINLVEKLMNIFQKELTNLGEENQILKNKLKETRNSKRKLQKNLWSQKEKLKRKIREKTKELKIFKTPKRRRTQISSNLSSQKNLKKQDLNLEELFLNIPFLPQKLEINQKKKTFEIQTFNLDENSPKNSSKEYIENLNQLKNFPKESNLSNNKSKLEFDEQILEVFPFQKEVTKNKSHQKYFEEAQKINWLETQKIKIEIFLKTNNSSNNTNNTNSPNNSNNNSNHHHNDNRSSQKRSFVIVSFDFFQNLIQQLINQKKCPNCKTNNLNLHKILKDRFCSWCSNCKRFFQTNFLQKKHLTQKLILATILIGSSQKNLNDFLIFSDLYPPISNWYWDQHIFHIDLKIQNIINQENFNNFKILSNWKNQHKSKNHLIISLDGRWSSRRNGNEGTVSIFLENGPPNLIRKCILHLNALKNLKNNKFQKDPFNNLTILSKKDFEFIQNINIYGWFHKPFRSINVKYLESIVPKNKKGNQIEIKLRKECSQRIQKLEKNIKNNIIITNFWNYKKSQTMETFLSRTSFELFIAYGCFPKGVIHDKDISITKILKRISEVTKEKVFEGLDPNHWSKNVTNGFMKWINSESGIKFRKILLKNRIKEKFPKKLKSWIRKCMYENHDNPSRLIDDISNSFFHWAGNHQYCRDICTKKNSQLNPKSNYFKNIQQENQEGLFLAKKEILKLIKPTIFKVITSYHTNYVESFNSLISKYAPKQKNFPKTYVLRTNIARIIWNYRALGNFIILSQFYQLSEFQLNELKKKNHNQLLKIKNKILLKAKRRKYNNNNKSELNYGIPNSKKLDLED